MGWLTRQTNTRRTRTSRNETKRANKPFKGVFWNYLKNMMPMTAKGAAHSIIGHLRRSGVYFSARVLGRPERNQCIAVLWSATTTTNASTRQTLSSWFKEEANTTSMGVFHRRCRSNMNAIKSQGKQTTRKIEGSDLSGEATKGYYNINMQFMIVK